MDGRTIKPNRLLTLIFTSLLALQACGPLAPSPTGAPIQLPADTGTPTPVATPTPVFFTPTPSIDTNTPVPTSNEIMVYSAAENGFQHLFLFSPLSLPQTRITGGEYDDITPAISPDGKSIAFASRRDGQFDLYQMHLDDGKTTRITDTPAFEANPSWSPDGQWLVYETNDSGSLDVEIRSVTDPNVEPIRLTDTSSSDHSPAWSPLGRQVAFVSNRSGDDEIWLANLDTPGEGRFINASNNPSGDESHPAWSADGSQLAWASSGVAGELPGIYIAEPDNPSISPRYISDGSWPAWSPSGQVASLISTSNSTSLVAYDQDGLLAMPVMALSGNGRGLDWATLDLPTPYPEWLEQTASTYPTPVWVPVLTGSDDIPSGRAALVDLVKVQAPYPQLHDAVNDSFNALRKRLVSETGWDVLASLENAYIPMSVPPDPALGDDWHYTGRAFSVNPVTLNAGWMVTVPEQFGSQLYWRVYVRPQAQDGSRGEPLRTLPFDLTARYNVDPVAYDKGGKWMENIPSGYWVDLTDLAQRYGWQRLPALENWRSYFKGARFNQFVLRGNLDWRNAMLELYPPEILVTPTPVPPPE